jgi:hypothetical protein
MTLQQKSNFYGSIILEKQVNKAVTEKFQIASSLFIQNEKRRLTA